jgi:hypothetical protein
MCVLVNQSYGYLAWYLCAGVCVCVNGSALVLCGQIYTHVRYTCAPEDGCKKHPKHVELRIKKDKEYIKKYIYLDL